MAKGDLHAVIRLNKLEIDELRRQLGVLLREEADLMERNRQLDATLAAEAAAIDANPELGVTFPAFLAAHKRRKAAVAEALADVQTRITRMRDALGELYRRRKTYELAQEARDTRAAQDRARREQGVLDEIGLTMHRRRRAEEDEEAQEENAKRSGPA